MLLGRRNHTIGDTIRYVVGYTQWLDAGVSATSATVTSDNADMTISGVVCIDGKVYFLAALSSSADVGDLTTVTVTMTSSKSEVKHDTIEFNAIAA